jgi:hypothetical protein
MDGTPPLAYKPPAVLAVADGTSATTEGVAQGTATSSDVLGTSARWGGRLAVAGLIDQGLSTLSQKTGKYPPNLYAKLPTALRHSAEYVAGNASSLKDTFGLKESALVAKTDHFSLNNLFDAQNRTDYGKGVADRAKHNFGTLFSPQNEAKQWGFVDSFKTIGVDGDAQGLV